MSSLYLRGHSIWIGYSDKAKIPRNRATGFKLEKIERRNGKIVWPREVLEFKKKFDRRIAYGRWGLEDLPARSLKLSELEAEFLAGHGSLRKPSTQYLYKLGMKKLIKAIGDVDARAIDEEDMLFWRAWLLKNEGDQNASRCMRSVSKIFNWAIEKRYMLHNPVTSEIRISPKTKPIVTFPEEDLEKVLAAAPETMRQQWEFLLLSGFRVGESCALKWEDVDFKEDVIRIWNEKEERWDYFPMDQVLRRFMEELPRDHDPYVFAYRNVWWVSRKMALTIKKLKLKSGLRLHRLRTTFISRLVNSGLSESEVMHLSRHRSITTTHKYYAAFDQKRMREALARSRKG